MTHSEIKATFISAYDKIVHSLTGNGRSSRLPGYEQAVQHRSKFESCGRVLTTHHGHDVKHWCRRPVCPTCASFWGRKLARKLIDALPESASTDYRMVTIILKVAATPDACFDHFRDVRRSVSNALDYRRRGASIDQKSWNTFGVAGSLEIDSFEADDFFRLGSEKQFQYRSIGFVPDRAEGPQWVSTVHALVHVGALGDAAVKTFFEAVSPVVHLQHLHGNKTLLEDAENVVGYAAKIQITTNLAGGVKREWSLESVSAYVASTMRSSRGRQGFKFSIKPKRRSPASKKYTITTTHNVVEPMPFIVTYSD